MKGSRGLAVSAALLGAAGVVLAALGAHLPAVAEEPARFRSWQAASLIHLVHVPLLLLLGFRPERAFRAPGWGLLVGVLLFSGSIYLAGVLGWSRPGPVAPAGGFLLIASWLWLAVTGWTTGRPS